MRGGSVFLAMLAGAMLAACVSVDVKLRTRPSEPLEEFTLQGKGEDRVALVTLRGFLRTGPDEGFPGPEPSPVQEVVSRLDLAAEDSRVKALILQIDSPGGTVTASDILYEEIRRFKERTGAVVVSLLVDLATSGGYYAALAGDRVVAHPTTVTGSIGVIFLRPDVEGLMDKVGVRVEAVKSGLYKDMGSPFRGSTDEERRLVRGIVEEMQKRFAGLVKARRGLEGEALERVARGQVMTAPEALEAGLVDRLGYFRDALEEARKPARLPEDVRVVVYRRERYHNDHPYNLMAGTAPDGDRGLGGLKGMLPFMPVRPGLYYLWMPAALED